MFRTTAAHVPPPAGVQPPGLWGKEDHVRALFGDGVSELRAERRTYTFRYRSPQHMLETFRTWYGPTHKAFAALDEAGQWALADDLAGLMARSNNYREEGDEPIAIPSDYLQVVATRAA
jgi:hypothetical protein